MLIPHAAAAASSDGAPAAASPAVSWGDNADGWVGKIVNESSTHITPIDVFNIPGMGTGWVVSPGNTQSWKGAKSIFGGPANVKATYSISGGGSVVFDAWSDFTGGAYVSCQVVGNDSYTCEPNKGFPGAITPDSQVRWVFKNK